VRYHFEVPFYNSCGFVCCSLYTILRKKGTHIDRFGCGGEAEKGKKAAIQKPLDAPFGDFAALH